MLPTRKGSPKEQKISSKLKKELGESGILRGPNGLPLIDPNQRSMSPFRARGLTVDHGALHRLLYYENVVHGVFTLTRVEILRALWGMVEYPDETKIESEKRLVFNALFGFEGHEGILGGGFAGLISNLYWAEIYGFSLVELMWDYVLIGKKRYFLPVDARWRAPWSIYRWIYSGETLVGATQLIEGTKKDDGNQFSFKFSTTPGGHIEQVIPIDKCLLYSNLGTNGNPEGISSYRGSYVWSKAKFAKLARKQIAEELLYRGIAFIREEGDERGPYKQVGDADRAAIGRMLTALRNGRTDRIFQPYGVKIEIDRPKYLSPSDIEDMEYYDKQMMLGASASLLGLDGNRGSGAGINDTLAQIAYHAIEHKADSIARVINGVPGRSFTGLIRKVEELNWGRGAGRASEVNHFGIGHQDIKKLIEMLSLGSQFMVYVPTAKDEILFRKMARLRGASESDITKARSKLEQQNGQLKSQSKQGNQTKQNNPKEAPADGNGKPK